MPEYRVFVRKQVEQPPAPEAYPIFGGSANGPADWDTKQTSYSPAATRQFSSGALSMTDAVVQRVLNNTRTQWLVMSYKTQNEAQVKAAIATMRDTYPDRTFSITWYHEPEDIPAAEFKAGMQLLRRWWVESGKPANVLIGTILMGISYRNGVAQNYWPEDVVVNGVTHKVNDFVGADQYDPGFKSGNYSDPAKLNSSLVAFAASKGLPIWFTEAGSGIGPHPPKRETNLALRSQWIKAFGDWCVANAGSGPGKVQVVLYWDVVAVKDLLPGTPEYGLYGPIPGGDFSLDLDPPIIAKAPGTLAGQVAYGGPDTLAPPIWRAFCTRSRAVNGLD